MACLTENELLEYADGLLDAERARGVVEHVADCATCRKVLAAIARSEPTTDVVDGADATLTLAATPGTPEEAAGAPESALPPNSADELPAALLERYLRKDARERELTASRFVLAITFVTLAMTALRLVANVGPPEPPLIAAVVQPAIAIYEIVLFVRMRRGWFHPAIPFTSSLFEVSIGFFMLMGVAATRPEEALTSPFHMLICGLVLFSAIRADPRIPIALGSLAAFHQVVLYWYASERVANIDVSAVHGPGAMVRVLILLACGAAGSVTARHFVRRSQEALREIRQQDMFGKYVLHERLGGGGMGEVFRATYCPEGGFARAVAVKRMRADVSGEPDFAKAFRREAQLSARLAHPNLVQVLDCGRFRGAFVFVMELIDGLSLAHLIRAHQALPARAVAYLGAEIAAGLAYVHARLDDEGQPLRLVHLDLNPPNVMISSIGEVKIADFGVARVGHGDGNEGFSGKVPYAAPEQLARGAVDARADIYALGLTLHEALTGRRVFTASDDRATKTVPAFGPATPPALADAIMRMLADDPSARPTAAEVRDALRNLEGEAAPYPNGAASLADAVRKTRTKKFGVRPAETSVLSP